MIIGIGTDLLDVRRLERTLSRFGTRFCERIFTDGERARAEGRADPARTYAQYFAAKEACSKALGTGLRQGVFWRDMRVQNLPSGKPIMSLTGGVDAARHGSAHRRQFDGRAAVRSCGRRDLRGPDPMKRARGPAIGPIGKAS